jgi:YggT family protein
MNVVVEIIFLLIQMMTFLIFFRVILSWVMTTTRNEFLISAYQVLVQLTDPILAPLRRIVPMVGMFDFTPIVAIILLQFIGAALAQLLS